MTGEHVILLDEQDKPVGRLEKYAAHTLNTPLHSPFPAGCLMTGPAAGDASFTGQKSLARGLDQLRLRTSPERRDV
jgi:hypothetical protein